MDDGSKSLAESLTMLEMAVEAGTTDIVATPHADLTYPFQPDVIAERAQELRARVNGRIHLYTGCDFHLTYDNIRDALNHPAKYAINQKSYLLVEFSDLLIFKNMAQIFGEMLAAGLRPVITHPERNPLLQQRLPMLKDWVAMGCLLQVTAHAPLGKFGRTARGFSIQLLDEGLVHFLASDAHDTQHRTTDLRDAWTWTRRHYGEANAERWLLLNPRAALEGEPLPPVVASPPGRRWFEFWR